MIYTKPAVLPAWGETNTTAQDMIQPTNGDIQTGWPLSATPPSRQRFNWILNFCANGIRYLMQRGLPDFDLAETYGIGSRVIGDDGITYTSIQAVNVGNLPSSSSGYWLPWALTLAQINAAQLTQVNPPAGDATSKVANTAWTAALVFAEATARINADNAEGAALTAETARAETAENALTAALAVTNTNVTTDAANLATFIAGFTHSIGANGYITLPGGVILQWMTGTVNNAGGSTDTQSGTWPIPFPNACLAAIAGTNWSSSSDSDIVSYQVQTLSAAGWTLRRARGGNYAAALTTTPTLFAIGN